VKEWILRVSSSQRLQSPAYLILLRRYCKHIRSEKTADCGSLRVINIENGQESSDLHDFVEFSAQMA
jgi:hypothetical protein